MTLPRKHRRSLTVGPTTYHYQVRCRADGSVSLVAAATSGGLRPLQTQFRPGTVVTPSLVRRFVEDALLQGWSPETTPDLRDFDQHSAPSSAPFLDGDRCQVQARLVARISGQRPACRWPQSSVQQEHYELSGMLDDAAVGDLLATWCASSMRATTSASLGALAQQEPYLPGGVRWKVDGSIHTEPGCCITLGERGEWLSCLDNGGFWGGHDPWVGVEVRDAMVFIHSGVPEQEALRLSRTRYVALLAEAETALRAFADRLEVWVSAVAPERQVQVASWFRRAAALD